MGFCLEMSLGDLGLDSPSLFRDVDGRPWMIMDGTLFRYVDRRPWMGLSVGRQQLQPAEAR